MSFSIFMKEIHASLSLASCVAGQPCKVDIIPMKTGDSVCKISVATTITNTSLCFSNYALICDIFWLSQPMQTACTNAGRTRQWVYGVTMNDPFSMFLLKICSLSVPAQVLLDNCYIFLFTYPAERDCRSEEIYYGINSYFAKKVTYVLLICCFVCKLYLIESKAAG